MRSRRLLCLALLAGVAAVPAAAVEISQLSLARMARPFIGGTAAPLTARDQLGIDSLGNRNGVYDIGDVRLVLLAHPELIPNGPVRTSRSSR